MGKRLVTKSDKNNYFNILKRIGLNPADFNWEEQLSGGINGLTVSAIVHDSREHYFVFDYCNNMRTPCFVRMSPGRDHSPQNLYLRDNHSYQVLFDEWIRLVKYELTTPDLWEELFKHKKLGRNSDIKNIPFTSEEQNHLTTKLDEMKLKITQSVNTQQLSAKQVQEQIQVIENQFEYIKTALSRFGRIDWKNLALGGVISLLTGIVILPECRPAIIKALEYIIQYSLTGHITYLE